MELEEYNRTVLCTMRWNGASAAMGRILTFICVEMLQQISNQPAQAFSNEKYNNTNLSTLIKEGALSELRHLKQKH